MYINITPTEFSALEVLRQTGVCPLQAAIIASNALISNNRSLKKTERCLLLGKESMRASERSITFAQAISEALNERKHLRRRTLSDMRYIFRRILKSSPELSKRRVRAISTAECEQYIRKAFIHSRQFCKARLVLSSLFSTAQKKGWCDNNPAKNIQPPRLIEAKLPILRPEEILDLLRNAALYRNGTCLPAVALMLYAGVRPNETERLTWEQIDLKNGYITIYPQHSKTGGARRVTIHPPLARILKRQQNQSGSICPKNWRKHWAALHKIAGWNTEKPWRADILRHTFATYHLLYFKSYEQLQWETGHRDSNMLRSRYIDMSLAGDFHAFWNDDII